MMEEGSEDNLVPGRCICILLFVYSCLCFSILPMSPVAVSQLSLFSESGVDEEATPGTLESQTGRHNSQQSPADKSITPAQRPRHVPSGERT